MRLEFVFRPTGFRLLLIVVLDTSRLKGLLLNGASFRSQRTSDFWSKILQWCSQRSSFEDIEEYLPPGVHIL
ncbi:hypothetical protein TcWFU_001911 [Taenia crassiceps]|uniref:Uncharacterized protein n=1 Tax=Taenia crassiceps TaxID=6207 RepID=A0ABR4QAZ4_9CEST